MLIGYACVSKTDGSPVAGICSATALRVAGVDELNLSYDFASSLRDDRPRTPTDCLSALRNVEVFVVWKLDRLGPNLTDAEALLADSPVPQGRPSTAAVTTTVPHSRRLR